MKTTIISAAIAAILIPAQAGSAQSTQCPDPTTSRAEVEQTIHDFFDALREEGGEKFKSITTQSMYSFDVGERFNETELVDVIVEALAQGVEINWNLGPMDTKIRCDVAWSAWENIGSAGVPPDVQPVRWLESAVLVHEDGRWKVDFFHSQRARSAPAPEAD